MPFNRPSLNDLVERVETSFKSELNIVKILRRSFIGATSRVIAGMSHLLLGFIQYIFKQAIPDTAEDEILVRWANLYGIVKNPATFEEFTLEFTGNDGGSIPKDRLVKSSSDVRYISLEEKLIVSGVAQVKFRAVNPGTSSSVKVGQELSLISPIQNVVTESTVISIENEASDVESDESLKERFISRLRLPPNGGSANDYITWAREVAGVTRSWVLPLFQGPGTVGVSFVVDNDDPIFPSAAKVNEVQEYILERKPVTATVTTFSPTPLSIDLDISIKPNIQSVQDAIHLEVEDLINREGQLAGSYSGPGTVYDGVLILSKLRQAISIAAGLEDFQINTINGNPPSNITPNIGELITKGAINWQTLA